MYRDRSMARMLKNSRHFNSHGGFNLTSVVGTNALLAYWCWWVGTNALLAYWCWWVGTNALLAYWCYILR